MSLYTSYDDCWKIDGNYWRKRKYTYAEALALSKTLINCTNCKDCRDCTGCTSCRRCTGCIDCLSSTECTDCISCILCLQATGVIRFIRRIYLNGMPGKEAIRKLTRTNRSKKTYYDY